MKHKHTFLASASAALAATASLGLTPAASATDIYMNPKAAITQQWQKNSATYGQPLSKEICVTGTGCAQQVENAVITWSRNTGVKVLSGAERAQAYVDAGGVKTLGALESDAWNNSFCGPSVTTFNGSNSSRWLLVVDEGKASVGSKIDLNSDAGKKWLAERGQTKQCFDAVAETPAPNTDPIDIDWSQATWNQAQESLVITVGEKTYVIAADSNGKPVADASAVEVPWLATDPSAASSWKSPFLSVEYTGGRNRQFDGLGYPVSAPVKNGDVYVQEFKYGTVTWTQDSAPTTRLNLEGAQRYVAVAGSAPLQKVDERFYAAESGTIIFDTVSGNLAALSPAMYENYMASPEKYGTVYGSYISSQSDYREATFTLNDKQSLTMTNFGSTHHSVLYTVDTTTTSADGTNHTETSGEHLASTWVPQAPATVDWSKAHYEPRQGALVYTDELSVLIVKANADGTAPAEGAPVYRSCWLGAQKIQQSRGTWTQFAEWTNGDWNGGTTQVTALGLPTADPIVTVKDGVSYETQQFEGGTITWRMLAEDNANIDQATITLNEIGQARLG